MLNQHGIGRRAREDRCSPRSVMRGTVRMTAPSLRPSRTGVRVVATRTPIVLMAPTDARSRSSTCGASIALDVPVYRAARLHPRRCARRRRLEAFNGGAGWPNALRAIATSGRTAPGESMPGTCWVPSPVTAWVTGVRAASMGLRSMEGVARSATGDGSKLRLAGFTVNRLKPSFSYQFLCNCDRTNISRIRIFNCMFFDFRFPAQEIRIQNRDESS